jgi:hypothetical protein
MTSKDIFSVVIRIVGLCFLYQGLAFVPVAITRFCPIFPIPLRYLDFRSLLPSLFQIGWPLTVAWWMLRGAPWLMRLAYPQTQSKTPAETPAGVKEN